MGVQMVKFIILGALIMVASVADSARDKNRDTPSWRRLYVFPRWVPGIIRRKFQDRWHAAKQIGFIVPMASMALWAVWDVDLVYAVVGFLLLAILAALAWSRAIPKPAHWS